LQLLNTVNSDIFPQVPLMKVNLDRPLRDPLRDMALFSSLSHDACLTGFSNGTRGATIDFLPMLRTYGGFVRVLAR
jgi:hypothetical protein